MNELDELLTMVPMEYTKDLEGNMTYDGYCPSLECIGQYISKLEEENRRLKKGLDLLLKTAIHNKQGNSIVVTDDLMRLKKEQGDE